LAKNYAQLSKVYDYYWGKWSSDYVGLIREILAGFEPEQVSILDLACGTGALAVELAKLGYFVVGVDISPEMIKIANGKTSDLPQVSFEVADMVEFETDRKFDCVTCTFDSINYLLETEQLQKLFNNVSEQLIPGGFFIFDSNTALLFETCQKGEIERDFGGQSFLQILDYNPIQRLSTTTFKFSPRKKEVHIQRPYDPDEIMLCLREAGLEVVRTYAGLKGEPFGIDSKRFICVAEKCG